MNYTEYDSIEHLCECLARQYGLDLADVEVREDLTVPKVEYPNARPERQTGHIMVSSDGHTIVQFIIEELPCHCPKKFRGWVYDNRDHVPI